MSFLKEDGAYIKARVDELFSLGRMSHAVLVAGGSEEERSAAAELIAQNAVCTGGEAAACNRCDSCRKAREGIHPDIITVQKPADKKFFQKDSLKAVVEGAYLTPNEAPLKVYIIKELSFMTEECQNVLLKILEEPPSYTSFVLTAQNANDVIKTVLSRVTRIRLDGEVKKELSQKAFDVVKNTLTALLSQFEFDVVAALAPVDGDKALTAEVISALTVALRDSVVQKFGGKPVSSFTAETKALCERFSVDGLLKMYDSVNELLRLCESYPNYTLLAAVLCVRLKSGIK